LHQVAISQEMVALHTLAIHVGAMQADVHQEKTMVAAQ
jgi:hypothetical protein